MLEKFLSKRHVSSFQIITVGFFTVILIGALLLMLPIASKNGISAPFRDTVFTSTSAVCVTGLVVRDTATGWSMFGQFIILLLIQIGGIGVVTVAVSIALLSGRRINLFQRSVMMDSIAAPQVGGIVRLTGFILKGTAMIELFGACLLSFVFIPEFGWAKGAWYSIFHSISAFCNAGFDLMGVKEQYSSLTSYAGNPFFNLTICLLIIIGGIGFVTWDDVIKFKTNVKKYRLQSKIVLTTSLVLILVPFVIFFFTEYASEPTRLRVLHSLFQAVTPRTAGFNTADYTAMSDSGKLFTICLMLIGGSPGSTAGGMKTTTIAVLVLGMIASMRQMDYANCHGRRIENTIVQSAFTILMMYLTLFVLGSMILSYVEGLPILTCMFECGSALGTVGLSLGVTPTLSLTSRIVLIVFMYLGRVGGLTLAFAAVSTQRRKVAARMPAEKIMVG